METSLFLSYSWLTTVQSFTSCRLILNMLEFGVHPNAALATQKHIGGCNTCCAASLHPMTTNVELDMSAFTQYRGDTHLDPSKVTTISSFAVLP
jgi:hypothetical protein